MYEEKKNVLANFKQNLEMRNDCGEGNSSNDTQALCNQKFFITAF